ncbi:RNA-binding protein [Leptolyngbya sp. FACHB-261]|uniref:RNA recognition motif domain-containing protein n=1 Tax=Leptolyngbya sp. FACHB-261 TaxID=2692806 RepID=UPI001689B1EF|nr:RNA-binding protein [Leptolyngbya sp. FACHB-261]MBD2103898.1 RNA-binding protein [Leptolyngbya sp. FACHB-261]
MSIYIGNLPSNANEDGLRVLFNQYGEVKRVQFPTDDGTDQVLVEMQEETQEAAAIAGLNGTAWMGSNLQLFTGQAWSK